MIAVSVTFHYGKEFSGAKLRQLAENSKSKFEHMPGLHSKLFSVFPLLREARNLYIWDDAGTARAFFTKETRDRIAALYGVDPVIEYAEVCALVENVRV